MNYYALLGVAEDASSESIHNAFRALARQYHPDAGEGSSAGKFREIVEAYETLGDPSRRHSYDRTLARERAPASMPNIVVEPLAQPWFASTSRPMSIQFEHSGAIDDLFDDVFRSFEEFLSYSWFGRR
jgi:DnaJ-class molecular chaperone